MPTVGQLRALVETTGITAVGRFYLKEGTFLVLNGEKEWGWGGVGGGESGREREGDKDIEADNRQTDGEMVFDFCLR